MQKGIVMRKTWFAALAMSATLAAGSLASAEGVNPPEEPWLDAGASAHWARPPAEATGLGTGGTSAGIAIAAGWRDAGAGAAVAESALAAARWQAWRIGALMSAEWRSDKLSMAPGIPFDTWLVVFSKGENGIGGVEEYVRGADNPVPLASYGVLRSEGLAIISRREAGSVDFAQPFATLRREGDAWVATTPSSMSTYRLLPGGGISVDRQIYGKSKVERYLPDGTASFTNSGVLERTGRFAGKSEFGIEEWTERPTREDLVGMNYYYQSVNDDSLKLTVDDEYEPIASAAFLGAAALTTGPSALENLAIADTVLGSDRRSTPILAWALLGRLPSRAVD